MTTAGDTVQERINRYWTSGAETYHDHQHARFGDDEARRVWSQVWADALPPAPAEVLDVGTGTGHVALLLHALGHRVVGLDAAPGMVDRARRTAEDLGVDVRFVLGDAVAPDVPPASVDAVTARYLLWTLRQPDVAVARWRDLLRPGGRLVVVDGIWFPSGVDPDGLAAAHQPHGRMSRDYDAEVLAALPLAEGRTIQDTADVLRAAGLVDVTVTPLVDVLALDRRQGVAPGHEVTQQHRVVGTRPGPPGP